MISIESHHAFHNSGGAFTILSNARVATFEMMCTKEIQPPLPHHSSPSQNVNIIREVMKPACFT